MRVKELADHLKPIDNERSIQLAERIGAALRACAPDANRSGWRARIADDIGASEESLRKWYYGECVPGGGFLLALFAHPELGDFADRVLGAYGLRLARAHDGAMTDASRALMEARREVARALDAVERALETESEARR